MADFGVGEDGSAVEDRDGFVEPAPGVHGWTTARLVWPLFVVEVDEAVDLGLELVE